MQMDAAACLMQERELDRSRSHFFRDSVLAGFISSISILMPLKLIEICIHILAKALESMSSMEMLAQGFDTKISFLRVQK